MKVKLDENIAVRASVMLSKLGHDAHTAFGEGLSGCADDEVWRVTQSEQRLLITHDFGFADTRRFVPGTHFGILLLRLRETDRGTVVDRLKQVFDNEDVDSWAGCLVVVSDAKVRVVRP
jgi:predicted nuclease of predicted toxin-antitoxin system